MYLIKYQKIYYSGHSKNVLFSQVLLQLDYLISVLMDLPKATLGPCNYTQRHATMLACNKTKRDSAQDCMKFLHWLPIEFGTKFKLMAIVFKTLQRNEPDYLQTKHKTKTYQRTTRRSTVKGTTLNAPFNNRTTYDDHGFTHIAASHWNNLPGNIRLAGDIRTYKETAQNTLLQTASQQLKFLKAYVLIYMFFYLASSCKYKLPLSIL